MATYTVMTGEGGELGTLQDYDEAAKVAQREADERGETIFVAGPGLHTAGAAKGSDEDIGEAFEPREVDGKTVRIVESSIDAETGRAEVVATVWGQRIECEVYVERQVPSGHWVQMQGSELPRVFAATSRARNAEVVSEIIAKLPREAH